MLCIAFVEVGRRQVSTTAKPPCFGDAWIGWVLNFEIAIIEVNGGSGGIVRMDDTADTESLER